MQEENQETGVFWKPDEEDSVINSGKTGTYVYRKDPVKKGKIPLQEREERTAGAIALNTQEDGEVEHEWPFGQVFPEPMKRNEAMVDAYHGTY